MLRRLLLALVVGLLMLSASGVTELGVADPCAAAPQSAGDDGACPPMCVTCGCCAQAVELVTLTVSASPRIITAIVIAFPPQPLRQNPHDILHVPKFVRA